LKKCPSWVLGSGQRQPLSGFINTPGTGNYNINSKVGEGPTVRIKILSIIIFVFFLVCDGFKGIRFH